MPTPPISEDSPNLTNSTSANNSSSSTISAPDTRSSRPTSHSAAYATLNRLTSNQTNTPYSGSNQQANYMTHHHHSHLHPLVANGTIHQQLSSPSSVMAYPSANAAIVSGTTINENNSTWTSTTLATNHHHHHHHSMGTNLHHAYYNSHPNHLPTAAFY